MIANVSFWKDVERDNYDKGCYGGLTMICEEKFTIEFTDKKSLIDNLAVWASSRFDIALSDFKKCVENECEPNRFDYAQAEDADGRQRDITPENPDGFYAMYFFNVTGVFKKVSFDFKN